MAYLVAAACHTYSLKKNSLTEVENGQPQVNWHQNISECTKCILNFRYQSLTPITLLFAHFLFIPSAKGNGY